MQHLVYLVELGSNFMQQDIYRAFKINIDTLNNLLNTNFQKMRKKKSINILIFKERHYGRYKLAGKYTLSTYITSLTFSNCFLHSTTFLLSLTRALLVSLSPQLTLRKCLWSILNYSNIYLCYNRKPRNKKLQFSLKFYERISRIQLLLV